MNMVCTLFNCLSKNHLICICVCLSKHSITLCLEMCNMSACVWRKRKWQTAEWKKFTLKVTEAYWYVFLKGEYALKSSTNPLSVTIRCCWQISKRIKYLWIAPLMQWKKMKVTAMWFWHIKIWKNLIPALHYKQPTHFLWSGVQNISVLLVNWIWLYMKIWLYQFSPTLNSYINLDDAMF